MPECTISPQSGTKNLGSVQSVQILSSRAPSLHPPPPPQMPAYYGSVDTAADKNLERPQMVWYTFSLVYLIISLARNLPPLHLLTLSKITQKHS
jgi:hypothetical protein